MKASVKKEIERGLKLGIKAKALEKEAKALKEKSTSILLPLMISYNIKKYEVEGLGKASVRTSHGKSISEAKLREQLLLAGMDLDQIETVIKASSRSWSTEYVEIKS